ncbi:SCO2524 family protein [Nocardia suismassiliense]|uniref:SCO2524 family protein n=1 Tax=Nocardia suismassiliense TaxID=2077092 RepID=A0ABW6R045_9NOCA
MRIQPREQLLDVWRALLAACWDGQHWRWGQQADTNSISDSEQLLCLLYPTTEIDIFALADPDRIQGDVAGVLEPTGKKGRLGGFVVSLLEQYLERNTDEHGEPSFAAGNYLRGEPTAGQRRIEVVTSYSMSLTVCLSGLRFLQACRAETRSGELTDRIDALSARLSARLTAAMTGLIRSFVVATTHPNSPAGQAMLGMLNQDGQPDRVIQSDLRRSLDRVRTLLLGDVTLGWTASAVELDDDTMLFECGWSWGVVHDAAEIDGIDARIAHRGGIADPRPHLYFTVIALDAINNLVAPRIDELGLLNEQQMQLAQALRLRWELAQHYWSTLARFGSGRWPLEDIPWRTSDGLESDYFSLLVSAVLIQDLTVGTAPDDDLKRAVKVFEELAARGRITRKATRDDPAVGLHTPGVRLTLSGSESVDDGPVLHWEVSDFAPTLLRQALRAAGLSSNVDTRDQLMELAKSVMDHLDRRMLRSGAATGLWDDPSGVFGDDGASVATKPSWSITERVVECLIAAERIYREPPPQLPELQRMARNLLTIAEHSYGQTKLGVDLDDRSASLTMLDHVAARIDAARQQLHRNPATTFVHALDALRDLEQLSIARRDASRGD